MSAIDPPPAKPGIRRWPLLLLAAVLLFAGTLWLDTRQNTFPFFYHPDEPDKVDQLVTGKWNFHHPLLMLETVQTVKRALGLPNQEQRLVVLGRCCSAVFAAGGVLFFALLAWRLRGWAGFWIIGLLLLTQHQVFELAHYFKEDTALFFTMALAFLALHVCYRRAGLVAAAFAGAACGLCLSAKYLGGVILVPAVVILAVGHRAKRVRAGDWLSFAAAFLTVAAAVNFPVFQHLDLFTHSFGRETELVAHGERGYTGGQVALLEYLRIFVLNTTPLIWVLLIVEMVAVWKRKNAFDRMMVLFPIGFMLLLSCSTKTNDRYFLPATGGFYYLAGLGAIDLPAMLSGTWALRLRPAFIAALAIVLNVFNQPLGLASYLVAFAHDDRSDMLTWIRANVPASDVIVAENHADLPNPRREERLAVQPLLPQRIIETKYAADLAPTPRDLAAQGISYLVISESDYGIFLRRAAKSHLAPELQQKRAFYEALFKDFHPVWERPRATGVYLHPGLSIYRLGDS